MNKFVITGRLGKKPELYNGDGYAKVNLNVASDKRVKNGDNWEKGTSWNSVTLFGKKAEVAAKYLEKGQHVTLEGVIETVKKDDTYKTYLTANEIEFGAKVNATGNNSNVGNEEDIPF